LGLGFLSKKEKLPYKKEVQAIRETMVRYETYSQEELEVVIKTTHDKKESTVVGISIMALVIDRLLDIQVYDVQLAGAYALSQGNLAQMRTGEGKTLTALLATLPAVLRQERTYVITVNEYLAERDYTQAKALFAYLGVSVGLVLSDDSIEKKKRNYHEIVVYTTNSEFAFDYLRDNIATSEEAVVQASYDFAIIDEADLVLIDEARNPVIISQQAFGDVQVIKDADTFVSRLDKQDIEFDDDTHLPSLTENGFEKAEQYFGFELATDADTFHAVRQALLAHTRFTKDVDYIVREVDREEEVGIVDKFTGRVLGGRRFQQGLHQAIEMKEGVVVKPENKAVATITYQNLFRKFSCLSGMTGTGIEAKEEFEKIYHMDVKVIPTNQPVIRQDHDDVLFRFKVEVYDEVRCLTEKAYQKGQPVLIGTTSVTESEAVAEALRQSSIPYQLLNAKEDKHEADIVSQAGQKQAVTIATNMAGRGTDIILGDGVAELGGLYVIGVGRNDSKRIDRQLIGRAGRQGHPGESVFLVSLEDRLVVEHETLTFKRLIEKLDHYPYSGKKLSKAIDDIQLIIDSQGEQIRQLQLQLDEIFHYHREYVYQLRKKALKNEIDSDAFLSELGTMMDAYHLEHKAKQADTTLATFIEDINHATGLFLEQDVEDYQSLMDKVKKKATERCQTIGGDDVSEVLSTLLMSLIDNVWQSYIEEIEHYKQGFAMNSMNEQDPIEKYSKDVDNIFKQRKQEATVRFFKEAMMRLDVVSTFAPQLYYVGFQMKPDYLFRFPLEEAHKGEDIQTILYSQQGVQHVQEGNREDTLDIHYQQMLNPGKYVVKNLFQGKEISRMAFIVVPEGIKTIDRETEEFKVTIPDVILPSFKQSEWVTCHLRHVDKGTVEEFQVPHDIKVLELGNETESGWAKGHYVISFIVAGLPMYHHEVFLI